MNYEFYYNWEHAQKYNPSLMMLGWSGGFGRTRANMRDAVRLKQRDLAEKYFWDLVEQSKNELRQECIVDGASFNDCMTRWFKLALLDKDEMFAGLRPYMRRKKDAPLPKQRDPNRNLYAILGAAIWFILVVLIAMMSKNA